MWTCRSAGPLASRRLRNIAVLMSLELVLAGDEFGARRIEQMRYAGKLAYELPAIVGIAQVDSRIVDAGNPAVWRR